MGPGLLQLVASAIWDLCCFQLVTPTICDLCYFSSLHMLYRTFVAPVSHLNYKTVIIFGIWDHHYLCYFVVSSLGDFKPSYYGGSVIKNWCFYYIKLWSFQLRRIYAYFTYVIFITQLFASTFYCLSWSTQPYVRLILFSTSLSLRLSLSNRSSPKARTCITFR